MTLALVLWISVFELLSVIVHWTVYATMVAAFGIVGGVVGAIVTSTGLKIVFVVLAFTFASASFLAHSFKNRVLDLYYTLSAYWFGLVNFFLSSAILFFVVENFLNAIGYYYADPALVGVICFGLLFVVHTYGTWESGRALIIPFTVTLPGLSAAWHGKKIVFVSDLHLGNVRREKFAAKVAEKIRALQPEMIMIGGDLYDGPRCDVQTIAEPIFSLRAPRGVYFITGNHEYYFPDVKEVFDVIKRAGIRILDNEKVDVGGLQVAGVDNKTTHRKENFATVMEKMNVDRNKPSILLKHEPSDLDIAEKSGISFGLFGHTHDGQIFPLNYVTRQIYRGFDYGFKKLGAMQTYTSSGVGTWGPPLRLGTKSEIVCIELR